MNLTFQLDKNKPAYIQISEYIKLAIIKGDLKSDEKLPSKRVLAQSLNVSINTIYHAYMNLIDNQFIYSIEKKGYFVNTYKQMPKIEEKKLKKEIKYDFTTKKMSDDLFPKMIWKKLYNNVLNENLFFNYVEAKGIYELRVAIKNHLYQNRGINASIEQIIIGSGIEYLMQLLFPLINSFNFGIENPGFSKIATILKNNNKKITYLDIDANGAILNETVDAIYITPFNEFPLGIKMSMSRKKEILTWLNNENKFCIEDDFDAEFRVGDSPTISLFSQNSSNVIFISSFSRTIGPSLRISYMILPNNLITKFDEMYHSYSNSVPAIDQYTLANFIALGHYQTHINKLKRVYKIRRKIIEEYFIDKKDFSIISKTNYLHFLLSVPKIISIPSNIEIKYLNDYDVNKANNNIVLLGYSNIKNNNLIDALDCLTKLFLVK